MYVFHMNKVSIPIEEFGESLTLDRNLHFMITNSDVETNEYNSFNGLADLKDAVLDDQANFYILKYSKEKDENGEDKFISTPVMKWTNQEYTLTTAEYGVNAESGKLYFRAEFSLR